MVGEAGVRLLLHGDWGRGREWLKGSWRGGDQNSIIKT